MKPLRIGNTGRNILTGISAMLVHLGIRFWLSPFLLRTLGVEAHGFVSLAGQMVTWLSLPVTALNAMAPRFITLAYVRRDYRQANAFYQTLFWGNLLLAGLLAIPAVILIPELEHLVDIPAALAGDVKCLFALVIALFLLQTATPNWSCAVEITNRLDLRHIPDLTAAILRCALLAGLFGIFAPRLWFVGLSSLAAGWVNLAAARHYQRKLAPELRLSLKKPRCSLSAMGTLLKSGVWSAISSGGAMLLSGLDLLLCNHALGPAAMGILALSKTLPGILDQFSQAITGNFGPDLTILYAQGDQKALLSRIRLDMKITTLVVTVPAAGIVTMGESFYRLWLPGQDAALLGTLTTLAILSPLTTIGTAVLHRIFAVVNRPRLNAGAMLVTGCISLLITTLTILLTDWDLYAVAGISSLVILLKNLCFVPPATARLLGERWYRFYPQVGLTMVCSGGNVLLGLVVRQILPTDSWLGFLMACGVTGILGLMLNCVIVLSKAERQPFLEMLPGKEKTRHGTN